MRGMDDMEIMVMTHIRIMEDMTIILMVTISTVGMVDDIINFFDISYIYDINTYQFFRENPL